MRWALASFLSAAAVKGYFHDEPGCHRALREISNQGHSDLQLAAHCRATLHPGFCKDASAALGDQPWSPERISSACRSFEALWTARAPGVPLERGVRDWPSLEHTLEDCMDAKAKAGVCRNPKTGRGMTLDQCIDHKQEMYPRLTLQIEAALNAFYHATMGTPAPPGLTLVAKFRQRRSAGPMAAVSMTLQLALGLFAAGAAAVAALLSLRRSGRGSQSELSLVEGGEAS